MYIHAYACECALGRDKNAIMRALNARHTPGMQRQAGWLQHGKELYVGCVEGVLPEIPEELALHRSRNNQLLLSCINQIRPEIEAALTKYGAERIGVVLGTSTSGLSDADDMVSAQKRGETRPQWHYQTQEMGDPALFAARLLKLKGPAHTVSTACSSSSRALISALRLIKSGLCDAVIAGGADTLSRMPLNGFNALGLVSDKLCAPFAKERCGITIGEGAGLMLISKEPCALYVAGCGESCDAYHISAPHPEGAGAVRAMAQALTQAGLKPEDIAYVNLHGTASKLNDKAEAAAMSTVFTKGVPSSSTKYLTGHTLGASGMVELCLCALTLEHELELVEQDFSINHFDDSLPEFGLIKERCCRLARPLVMSNAFAFGGNNTSVILRRAD